MKRGRDGGCKESVFIAIGDFFKGGMLLTFGLSILIIFAMICFCASSSSVYTCMAGLAKVGQVPGCIDMYIYARNEV